MNTLIAVLLSVLALVESKGEQFPPTGAAGEVGPLQIRTVLVDDLNRLGYSFTYEDRHSLERSKEMFRAYMHSYATPENIGRRANLEDMARIWNGGPDGWRESETLPYWQRVRRELLKQYPKR